MIVEAEVVDRDSECHLLRTEDGRLLQATFDPDTVFRVGDVLTIDLDKVEVIS